MCMCVSVRARYDVLSAVVVVCARLLMVHGLRASAGLCRSVFRAKAWLGWHPLRVPGEAAEAFLELLCVAKRRFRTLYHLASVIGLPCFAGFVKHQRSACGAPSGFCPHGGGCCARRACLCGAPGVETMAHAAFNVMMPHSVIKRTRVLLGEFFFSRVPIALDAQIVVVAPQFPLVEVRSPS